MNTLFHRQKQRRSRFGVIAIVTGLFALSLQHEMNMSLKFGFAREAQAKSEKTSGAKKNSKRQQEQNAAARSQPAAETQPQVTRQLATSPSLDLSALQMKWRQAIKSSDLKESEVALWVSDGNAPSSGAQVSGSLSEMGLRQDEKMIPASLSKIPTAAAVLSLLPAGFKMRTRFMAEPQTLKGSEIAGSLYLVGGGDPAFVSESMWFLVNELSRTGVKTIKGDLIVDDSLFDQVRFPEGRDDQRVDRAYDAPIGAMSFNWNSVSIYVRPGEKSGSPARVLLDPSIPYLELKNEVVTSQRTSKGEVTVQRKGTGQAKETFVASGAVGTQQPETVIYKSIRQPDLFAGQAAIEFLKQRGITVSGQVRNGVAPTSVETLAQVESKPLPLIVTDVMKWSNNFAAEMLVKQLAAESGERPATMKTGVSQVQKWIQSRIGLNPAEFVFQNPAGLTRDNQFTARQLGLMLNAVRRDFKIYHEFTAALPVAGVDGTLRSRFGKKGSYWVRAKTGLLTGVVGLAGYAGREDGSIYTFSFMFNGRADRATSAKAMFDQFASELAENE